LGVGQMPRAWRGRSRCGSSAPERSPSDDLQVRIRLVAHAWGPRRDEPKPPAVGDAYGRQ
jgi:hypothetical protein